MVLAGDNGAIPSDLANFDDLTLRRAFEEALQKSQKAFTGDDGQGAPKRVRTVQDSPYKESRLEFLSKVGLLLGDAEGLDNQLLFIVTSVYEHVY